MKPQIKYTQTGREEIDRYMIEQKNLLEKYLLQEKYIIGDETIEITGSDIVRIKQKLDISYKKPKSSSLKLASYLYGIMGVIITLFGFLYPYIHYLLVNNRQQAIIILTGLLISCLGLFVGIYVRYREKREREKFRKESMDEVEMTLTT